MTKYGDFSAGVFVCVSWTRCLHGLRVYINFGLGSARREMAAPIRPVNVTSVVDIRQIPHLEIII